MKPIKQQDNQEGHMTDDAIPKNGSYWIYCIVGARGRGKTSILISLLQDHLKKYYDNIYLVSTTGGMDPKLSDLIEELQVDNHFYDHFSEDVVSTICEEIKAYNSAHDSKRSKPRSLIVFDDCVSDLPKSSAKMSAFNRLIVGSRHYKTDIIITTQQFRKLNTLIRSNLDIISLFGTSNMKELNAYSEDLNINKGQFESLLESIEYERHAFLTINFLNGKPRFYKAFNRIE